MQIAILVNCHDVQEAGGETAVKLNIFNTTSDKELMTIAPREDGTMR
jgi:selenophosphate synthetase-related protein